MSHNPDCLHCVVGAAIEEFYARRPRTAEGKILIDRPEIINALSENIGELVAASATRTDRRRMTKYAQEALAAGIKAAITGRRQPVRLPPLETEH